MTDVCECPVCGAALSKPVSGILPLRGLVMANGKQAKLTPHEMDLFNRLVEISPRALSRDAALDWLYQLENPINEPGPKIIDVFICRIRQKIKPLGLRIDTVPGVGYSFPANAGLEVVRDREVKAA